MQFLDLTKTASYFLAKLKVDYYFFIYLFKGLSDEDMDNMKEFNERFFDNLHAIYKHGKIKPSTYRFDLPTALNSSEEVLQHLAMTFTNEYLRDFYFILTTEQGQEKFFPAIKSLAELAISENEIDESEAINYALHTVLMEEFLTTICFPGAIRSYIEEWVQDTSYQECLEAKTIQEKWNTFKDQIRTIASIITVTF